MTTHRVHVVRTNGDDNKIMAEIAVKGDDMRAAEMLDKAANEAHSGKFGIGKFEFLLYACTDDGIVDRCIHRITDVVIPVRQKETA